MKLERRFSKGLGFLIAYTFSKLIGDVGRNIIDFGTVGGAPQGSVSCGQDAKFDRRSCRSIEPQDVTHQYVLSTVYELPFGRGSGGWVNHVIGGFQLNGILTLRSGLPLVVRGANNRAADRPNLVGDPELPARRAEPDALVQYGGVRRTAALHLRHDATDAGERARAGFRLGGLLPDQEHRAQRHDEIAGPRGVLQPVQPRQFQPAERQLSVRGIR